MNSAWASYNKKTGNLTGICWVKPENEPAIEIDTETATMFLTGVNNLLNYKISETDSGLQLVKAAETTSTPLFWSLTPISDVEENFKFSIEANKIVITIKSMPELAMLFATEKNDPTWLSHTWNLHTLPIKRNKITIALQSANTYSFYMSKSNES